MNGLRNASRFTFLTFTDRRQRMMTTFRQQTDSVAFAAQSAPLSERTATVWPSGDAGGLTIARLFASNDREIGRTAASFGDLEDARRFVSSLIAAEDLVHGQVVGEGNRWGWYLTLSGTTVLVCARWFTAFDSAAAQLGLARQSLRDATVSTIIRRLPPDSDSPLAAADARTPQFSPSKRSRRRDSEMPAPIQLGAGIAG